MCNVGTCRSGVKGEIQVAGDRSVKHKNILWNSINIEV